MPGFFSRHREPVTGMDRRDVFGPEVLFWGGKSQKLQNSLSAA